MIITKVDQAVSILRQGGLVAFPTETVYGLGADAKNAQAVAKVFAAKGRPSQHPLIVHVANRDAINTWAERIPEGAWRLAEHYWPGPLTLILPKQAHVLDSITGNQASIGLRIPAHPLAQALLQAFGGGLVGPSANQFTHISPTTAQAVQEELGTKVDAIIDGGACTVGVESTIIDFSQNTPRLLRPGMIHIEELQSVLGEEILMNAPTNALRAPGMYPLHYAPRSDTKLITVGEIAELLITLPQQTFPVAVMAYSKLSIKSEPKMKVVQMPSDAKSYAQLLYQTLRQLDQGVGQIWIEALPDTLEWAAINDRVRKACGRR